jgi:hypothetical protein
MRVFNTSTPSTLQHLEQDSMKPIAYLTIVNRGPMTSYRVTDDVGKLIWATRAFSTEEGRDGARERLRAWTRATGYKVVMAGKEVRQAS